MCHQVSFESPFRSKRSAAGLTNRYLSPGVDCLVPLQENAVGEGLATKVTNTQFLGGVDPLVFHKCTFSQESFVTYFAAVWLYIFVN